MTTLVLHAPKWRVRANRARSFEQVMNTGIGDRYAIPAGWVGQCQPGIRVVVLCKEERKRAEGTLIRLVRANQAGNRMWRYDVHIQNLAKVPYVPESLYRSGVALKVGP